MRKTPRVAFSTPVALDRPLAGLWTRGGAFAIDLLIIGAIDFALLLIVWAVSGSPALTAAHAETLALEVGLPVGLLYAPLLLSRPGEHNGQTVGKQRMGVRVIRDDGQAMTFVTAVVREVLGRQFPAALTSGLYVPFDYLWALWDARNQTLHDKIGRTFVVAAAGGLPGQASNAPAWRWAEREEDGPVGEPQTVRGDWLPPVAPSPGDVE